VGLFWVALLSRSMMLGRRLGQTRQMHRNALESEASFLQFVQQGNLQPGEMFSQKGVQNLSARENTADNAANPQGLRAATDRNEKASLVPKSPNPSDLRQPSLNAPVICSACEQLLRFLTQHCTRVSTHVFHVICGQTSAGPQPRYDDALRCVRAKQRKIRRSDVSLRTSCGFMWEREQKKRAGRRAARERSNKGGTQDR
jgi:hypothetical protein